MPFAADCIGFYFFFMKQEKRDNNKDLLESKQEDLRTVVMRTVVTRRRWRWIGHVLREEGDSTTRTVIRWTHEEKRRRGWRKPAWH